MIFLCLPILFALSVVLTHSYRSYALKKQWVDVPGHRSSHVQTTPRGGGLVFVSLWFLIASIAALTGYWPYEQAVIFLPGAMAIAMTGFCDDRISLTAKSRALIYLAAASFSVFWIVYYHGPLFGDFLPWVVFTFAMFVIAWSVNLFNFMDGMDGIAGVEALFTLGVGGFFLWEKGGENIAFVVWLLAAGVAGFLVWNKPPAKLFMGDVGSTTLGFVIMVLAIFAEKKFGIPITLWFILYAVFLFDASITLLRRILAKEKWYQAHRLHAYQRLHQSNWSHARVLSALIGLNSVLALLALFVFYNREWIFPVLIFVFSLLSFLYLRIEKLKPMYPKV